MYRFGGTSFAACLAAVLAALPATWRTVADARDAPSAASVLLVTSSILVIALLPLAVLGRGAWVALRAFPTASSPRAFLRLALWTSVLLPTLILLGAQLRASTHHHALAGVTYAVVAAGCGALAWLLTSRLAALTFAVPKRTGSILLTAEAAAIALFTGASGWLAVRGAMQSGDLGALQMLVDGLALLLGASWAASFDMGHAARSARWAPRIAAAIGPPMAAALVIAGFSTSRRHPELLQSILAHAPLYAPVRAALSALLPGTGPI